MTGNSSDNIVIIFLQGLAIKEGIIPELMEEDLEMIKVIGRGAYGDVHEGTLLDRETGLRHCIAVKTLKSKFIFVKVNRYSSQKVCSFSFEIKHINHAK